MAQKEKSSSVMEDVKKGLGKAADLTSLKFKLGQAKTKRKNAYTRLGELAYSTYRPRTDAVTADIENAIAAAVKAALPTLTVTGIDADGVSHSWTMYGVAQ